MKVLQTLAIPCLVLAMSMGCGKKTPEGTTPPGETGSEADGGSDGSDGDSGSEAGSSGDAGDGGGDGGDGGGDPNAVPECPAEVSDTPTALFGEKLVMRLPKGVELVERSPMLMTANNVDSTCDAIISRMAVGYFEYDPNKAIKDVRDGILTQLGYAEGDVKGWADEKEKKSSYTGTFEVGEGPNGEPPVQGLLTLKEAEGIQYWAIYETHPNAWPAIKATFAESAKRILINRN